MSEYDQETSCMRPWPTVGPLEKNIPLIAILIPEASHTDHDNRVALGNKILDTNDLDCQHRRQICRKAGHS